MADDKREDHWTERPSEKMVRLLDFSAHCRKITTAMGERGTLDCGSIMIDLCAAGKPYASIICAGKPSVCLIALAVLEQVMTVQNAWTLAPDFACTWEDVFAENAWRITGYEIEAWLRNLSWRIRPDEPPAPPASLIV